MSAGLANDKRAMRSALIARRSQVVPADGERWSGAMSAHLDATLGWRRAGRVAAFVGVGHEPDTMLMLQAALGAGKRLWLPRVVSRSVLEFVEVTDLGTLCPAPFGLLEPDALQAGLALGAVAVDLVIVPGLAFGSDGARIGFGRGHYDRALAGLVSPRPMCIGLCYASFLDPVEGAIPMEPHDWRVDHVLTERGVLACGERASQ